MANSRWGLLACPRHRWNEGWYDIEIAGEIVDAFGIIGKELTAEESASQTKLAQHVHLAGNHIQIPVLFAWMHHVNSQAWSYHTSVAMLQPIYRKGEEVIALKIHHREQGIHQSVAQPSLGILTHGGVGIPARTFVTSQVVVFSYRRAR